jgi:deoxycytidine triphosphate deaminase
MILGYEEILKLIKEGVVENCPESSVQPAGVDLRVGRFYRLKSGAKLLKDSRELPEVEEIQEDKIVLKPGEYILVETMEKINTPADILALVLPRTTLFRSGVSLRTGVIDPGFNGTLTFGMKNEGNYEFVLERGARIAQMILLRVEGKTKLYNGRYQGGKVV